MLPSARMRSNDKLDLLEKNLKFGITAYEMSMVQIIYDNVAHFSMYTFKTRKIKKIWVSYV